MTPRPFAPLRLAAALAVALALPACLAPAPTESAPPTPTQDAARRLAAILDYLAADYGGAVKDGAVVSESEYAEQLSFVKDAQTLAAGLPAGALDPKAEVGKVAALIDGKAAPETVATAARALRQRLLAEHHVELAPKGPPSHPRGVELFSQACASCHGATGAADGPAAAALNPKPRNFQDPAVMAELTPARVFNALTDGLKGTAMPAFGALSESDRWNLAFHVFTLRHDAATVAAGAAAMKQVPGAVAATFTAAELAGLSDGELLAMLGRAGLDETARDQALAQIRGELAFKTDGAPLDVSRRYIALAISSYRGGKPEDARAAAGAAYLDGFEPHEGSLKARDAAFVGRVEEAFLDLRRGIEERAPVERVEQEAFRINSLLDRGEAILAGDGGPGVAFAGALVVVLREGLEAALLVLMLLGMARKAGAGADAKAVHLGWGLAAAAGIATWFASSFVVELGGAKRELMEGVVSLFAAAVLLFAGHWVLARMDAKRRVDALKERLKAANNAGRRRAVLVTLGFVAVYREAFEVVLFLRAIAIDHRQGTAPVALGAAVGGVLLVGLVMLLKRLGSRLKPGPLLTASGTLLCLLAVVLAGKGVRALQEAGVLSITPLPIPRLEWFGLFPTAQGLVAQLLVLAVFAFVAASALRRAPEKPSSATPANPSATSAG